MFLFFRDNQTLTGNPFVQGFIKDSVNIPLYRPIEGWDAYKVARRIGYALFGVMNGTEPNPNFMSGRSILILNCCTCTWAMAHVEA